VCINIHVLNTRHFTDEKVGAKLINSMANNTQNNQGDWKNREVGALWKKAAANGKSSFCTGYIVSDELGNKVKQRVIMFSNKTKSNEKSPDFIIYLSNEQENPEGATAPAKTKAAPPKRVPQPAAAEADDDGIPM
jgi:phage I-like protein